MQWVIVTICLSDMKWIQLMMAHYTLSYMHTRTSGMSPTRTLTSTAKWMTLNASQTSSYTRVGLYSMLHIIHYFLRGQETEPWLFQQESLFDLRCSVFWTKYSFCCGCGWKLQRRPVRGLELGLFCQILFQFGSINVHQQAQGSLIMHSNDCNTCGENDSSMYTEFALWFCTIMY